MGRRRIKAFCLGLLLFVALPAIADDTAHPVTMWKISGAKNSVYLLGSIHLLRSQDYPLPVVLEDAYADAEVLIMEIDMDDIDPVATQQVFSNYGVLHDDRTLRDLMGNELYRQATIAAEVIDIPLEMLSKTEPWYAAMTVEMMMLGRFGFNPALGVEMHMTGKATRDGKPIEGFETIEEQLQFLDGMSLPAQRAMLLSTLQDSAKMGEMMDDLIDAWRYGNVDFLEDGILDELAEHAELKKALVTDRNARWVTKIEALLDDDDDYLIVVGALHLVGHGGVPELLDRNGHEIHQLRESPSLR